jgi:hypothetical protein
MRPFKFFQKEVKGTLDLYEGETRATASLFNADNADGHVYRRRLYHTDRELYDRLHNASDEIERFTLERALLRRDIVTEDNNRTQILNGTITQEQYNLNRDMLAQQESVRRRLIETDNQIRLFQATTVTTVNPKWWMKIKMGLQKLSIFFKSSPYGIMILWATSTIGAILILSKILSIW